MSGTLNARKADTANGIAPNRNQGLLFPHLDFVLSIANPTKTSVTASITRHTTNIAAMATGSSSMTSV